MIKSNALIWQKKKLHMCWNTSIKRRKPRGANCPGKGRGVRLQAGEVQPPWGGCERGPAHPGDQCRQWLWVQRGVCQPELAEAHGAGLRQWECGVLHRSLQQWVPVQDPHCDHSGPKEWVERNERRGDSRVTKKTKICLLLLVFCAMQHKKQEQGACRLACQKEREKDMIFCYTASKVYIQSHISTCNLTIMLVNAL